MGEWSRDLWITGAGGGSGDSRAVDSGDVRKVRLIFWPPAWSQAASGGE